MRLNISLCASERIGIHILGLIGLPSLLAIFSPQSGAPSAWWCVPICFDILFLIGPFLSRVLPPYNTCVLPSSLFWQRPLGRNVEKYFVYLRQLLYHIGSEVVWRRCHAAPWFFRFKYFFVSYVLLDLTSALSLQNRITSGVASLTILYRYANFKSIEIFISRNIRGNNSY